MTDKSREEFEALWNSLHAHHRPFGTAYKILAETSYVAAWQHQQSRIDELERRLAEIEKNAERYQWLRDHSMSQWEHPIVVSQERKEIGMRYLGPLVDEALDSAIDTAISAQKEK